MAFCITLFCLQMFETIIWGMDFLLSVRLVLNCFCILWCFRPAMLTLIFFNKYILEILTNSVKCTFASYISNTTSDLNSQKLLIFFKYPLIWHPFYKHKKGCYYFTTFYIYLCNRKQIMVSSTRQVLVLFENDIRTIINVF